MPDKCVILCPGPSLRHVWPIAGEKLGDSVVLAVNEAGAFYAHDWYVAWDTKAALRFFNPRPRVGIACRPVWANKYPDALPGVERFELPDTPHFSRNFTLPRAAALVQHLGFDKATLYGCDWEGEGSVAADNYLLSERGRQRWEDERRVTEAYCRHFGVVFHRYDKDSWSWEDIG